MASKAKANALAAAMSLLLLCSRAAYYAFANLRINEDWVQHTREVKSSIDLYGKTLTRASRMRAQFVDSGDDTLLRGYTESGVAVRNATSMILSLTTDNASQRASLRKLGGADRTASYADGKSDPTQEVWEVNVGDPGSHHARDYVDSRCHGSVIATHVQRGSKPARAAPEAGAALFFGDCSDFRHRPLVGARVVPDSPSIADRPGPGTLAGGSGQRALAARLLTLQDEERRRFAREQHDSVGQHLAALKMAVSLQQSKPPTDAVFQDCIRLLDDAIAETRTISHLLHPPLLDEAGLNSASRWFVEGFGKRSGIDVHLDIRDGAVRLSESIDLVLFRVLQESLTNVHRHSGATGADVGLNVNGGAAILRVKNNGHGVPAGVLLNLGEDAAGAGVGLAGMTERLREIGGRLEVNSNAAGTEIVARVPVRYRPKGQQISPAAAREVG